jgi:gluconolactonase
MSDWRPASRYPDPAVQILDPRFEAYRIGNAAIERIVTGLRWAEGPVWFGDAHALLVSDIPGDRILRWDEATGETTTFRRPSNYSNGNTRDRQGRLVTCEHGGRRVTRTEYDGSVTVIADGYDGKRLNSPNDVVVASDDSIWFTDPAFGIGGDYEGYRAEAELPTQVYRWDARSGELAVVADDVPSPNGLAFSPDESVLYVVESHGDGIRAFDVTENGTALAGGRPFIHAEGGTPDGLRIDEDGNLWCGWTGERAEVDGVRIYTPDAELIGFISLPEPCANLTFGGRAGNRLFMAASTSVYSLYVNTRGAARPGVA